MSDVYRIHPTIGIARVGNSQGSTQQDYYLAPESMAGLSESTGSATTGGLPINPATGNSITSSDLRDTSGAFKRQAARFKIYHYPDLPNTETYPNGGGTEITIGSMIGSKTVTDIIWTVHVANKKANTFVLVETTFAAQGLSGYQPPNLPPIRNYPIPPVLQVAPPPHHLPPKSSRS